MLLSTVARDCPLVLISTPGACARRHLKNHCTQGPARVRGPLRIRRRDRVQWDTPTVLCELCNVESIEAHVDLVNTRWRLELCAQRSVVARAANSFGADPHLIKG